MLKRLSCREVLDAEGSEPCSASGEIFRWEALSLAPLEKVPRFRIFSLESRLLHAGECLGRMQGLESVH